MSGIITTKIAFTSQRWIDKKVRKWSEKVES